MTIALLASLVAGWMVGALLIGSAIGGLAWLVHHTMRDLVPARLIWGVALFGGLAVGVALPIDLTARKVTLVYGAPSATITPAIADDVSVWERLRGAATVPMRKVSAASVSITTGAARVVYRAPAAVHYLVLLAWPLASLVLLSVAAAVYARNRSMVQRAELVQLQRSHVAVTDDVGPAVVGIRAPRIVVPRWLLDHDAEEQRLVLAHEQAHIDARDPLLLLLACGAVICMPWNAAFWWMLARLRLAIELDCDARVLASGTARRRYGELLVELSSIGAAQSGLSSMPAFSFRASHLERRLRTMTSRPTSHRMTRRTTGVLLTAAAIMAACGAELPTSAELEGMDVAAAELKLAPMTSAGTTTLYRIDGKEVTYTEAKALSADRIASIDVKKLNRSSNEVSIRTNAEGTTTSLKKFEGVALAVRKDGTADTTRSLTIFKGNPTAAKAFEGLIFIDGMKVSEDAMKKLSPEKIQSIEVVKGAAAEKLYGAEGSNGAIRITMKK